MYAIRSYYVVFIIFFGYLYYRIIGESTALVSTGLISFVAASQFAPSLIGGLYWRRANHLGASTGLICGFVIWFYTLVITSYSIHYTKLYEAG